jgi:hypothetical protein
MKTLLSVLLAFGVTCAHAAPAIKCPAGKAPAWVSPDAQSVIVSETINYGEGFVVSDASGQRRYMTGGGGTGISTRVAVTPSEGRALAYDWDGDTLIWGGITYHPECR